MFIFELIGRLLYGSDYEELSKRANRKNQRENAADRTVETARFTRGLFSFIDMGHCIDWRTLCLT